MTTPYSPQSNGIAEQKNRTLTDMINAPPQSSGLHTYMWEEALNMACHILNRVPHKHKESSRTLERSQNKSQISQSMGVSCKSTDPRTQEKEIGT